MISAALCRPLAVLHGNDGLYPAAQVEIPDDSHPLGMNRGDEIVVNPVHGPLIKNSVVAVAPEIQLETLELDARVAGIVRDADDSKIRRATFQ